MSQTNDPALAVAKPEEILDQLKEARLLASQGHTKSSLLLGWSALEAIARRAIGDRLAKPQRPGSVIEMLAYEGHVSPTEADRLRPMIRQRNRLIHGELAVQLTSSEIDDFLDQIERVHSRVETPRAA